MGSTYANPDVAEGVKAELRQVIENEGSIEPWQLVDEVDADEDNVRKALRSMILGGELTHTADGNIRITQ